ncbi:MAG: hypothetical protein EO766_08770 [Hydrotalea sp. AMD]|uniref:hypothetical protein n=1 Tax=Hydrotalea sp. AMD TaxID=2501297 RepID=UPI000944F5B6|nr:hypothetical protein [Hydrotalea sp. AMD]RWZ88079.1 MAG: hypothetical protein EO766_08770 [Hydrotalea sp. AMD]
MKKIASIVLLGMLLFNWVGYRFVMDYLENRADIAFQSQLDDNQYNEKDLISIKVPAALPYGASSQKFDRVNGEITVNGITYAYVKRRFYQDSLEVLCIPNFAKTGIKNARDAFAKLANDFVNSSSSKKDAGHQAHTVKPVVQDYNRPSCYTCQHPTSYTLSVFSAYRHQLYQFILIKQLDKPPELSAATLA